MFWRYRFKIFDIVRGLGKFYFGTVYYVYYVSVVVNSIGRFEGGIIAF